MQWVSLSNMVTVVDASTFLQQWNCRQRAAERPDLGEDSLSNGKRKVVELLVEQIECADVILMNKVSLLIHTSHYQ